MKFFYTLLFLVLFQATAFADEESAVIEVSDFKQLSLKMKQNKMGLVMMLHAEHCAYCELMDNSILSPMVRSGEYKNRVFIRKLQIDKPEFVIDFDGEQIEASEFADIYNSQLTPTLIFLNHMGQEKALKIVGINSIELFGATVDQQIDKLVRKVQTITNTKQQAIKKAQ